MSKAWYRIESDPLGDISKILESVIDFNYKDYDIVAFITKKGSIVYEKIKEPPTKTPNKSKNKDYLNLIKRVKHYE